MHNNEGAGLNVKNRKSLYFNVGGSIRLASFMSSRSCNFIIISNSSESVF